MTSEDSCALYSTNLSLLDCLSVD